MSISSEISRISGNVQAALTAIANKGVTVASGSNSDDLATLIAAIPTYRDIYPVGSLWATESSTAKPATVLGFGTWTQVSPSNITWGNLYNQNWNVSDYGSASGVYVYKRTA